MALEILLRCPFLESIYTEKMHQKPKQKKKKLTITIDSTDPWTLHRNPPDPPHTHTHTQSFLQVQETMKYTSTQTWPTQIWSLNSSNLCFFFRRRCSKDGKKHRPKQIPETTMQQNPNVTDRVRDRETQKLYRSKDCEDEKRTRKAAKFYLSISILLRPIDLPFSPLLHRRQAQPASSISLSCIVSHALYKTRRRRTLRSSAHCDEVRFQAPWTRARTSYCRLLRQVKSTKS